MPFDFKAELLWIAILVSAAVIPFSSALRGDFVYDDRRQIVMNPLIQNSALYDDALTSDVWAFKGDGTLTASNYWRPTFTLWCILSFLVFGLDPLGWHLMNLFLHAAVCVVTYVLLRRWGIGQKLSFAIVLIFAVHPVHTESVAWISGSPDILMSLFLLLALLFADKAATSSSRNLKDVILAVIFYALALGSKEVALFCAPMYLLIFGKERVEKGVAAKAAVIAMFGVAAAYFIARWSVIGRLSFPVPESPGLTGAILTAPSAFLFYLRQIFSPIWLGPNYPLRPVGTADVVSIVVPVLITIAVAVLLFFCARGSFVRKLGLALFILPLLPAFIITSFPSDQIVHDRYLYLPLLGLLIVVVTCIGELVSRRRSPTTGEKIILWCSVAISAVLGVQSFQYSSVWKSDLALWRHAVTIDENSASNWLQLGAELASANDLTGAAQAYERSLAIRQDPLALMGNSRVAIARGDIDRAVRDLERVIGLPPEDINAYTLFQTYQTLAVAHQQQKDFAAAERRLREGRDRLPIYRAALTDNLAVVLYLQNRKQDALAELESVRVQARREMLPASKLVFFRLGMLYAELGRKAEARSAFEEYLSVTANEDGRSPERRQAVETLRTLR